MAYRFKRKSGGESGVVYVEFLLVIMPFLLMFFGLTHLGLLYSAHLLVSQAAAKTVRAAIVVLPDEYGDYDGVELNRIGTGGDGLDAYMDTPEGGRLETIREAARFPVSPLSPAVESYSPDSLAQALGDHPGMSTLAGLFTWSVYATAVTFPDDADGYLSQFPAEGYITARVTFLYKCSVPIFRGLVCSAWSDLPDRARRELATTGVSALMGTGTEFVGWRFAALTAERTMPNQGK